VSDKNNGMKEIASTHERIKELRARLDLSMEQLAKRSGISLSSISRWENGTTPTIKLSSIDAIAHAVGVNPFWLMGFDVPFEQATEAQGALCFKISEELLWLDEADLRIVLKIVEEFVSRNKTKQK